MVGKRSWKTKEVGKISKQRSPNFETFTYNVLSFTLKLCGFPCEKLITRSRQNIYTHAHFVSKVGSISLEIALTFRDQWKAMLESRLRSSGLDTIEKIIQYLKSVFAIIRDFQEAKETCKMYVLFATYSETMLFLNYKGIELDLAKLIHLCYLQLMECNKLHKSTVEVLAMLNYELRDLPGYMEHISKFIEDFAIPYGFRDVSLAFVGHSEVIKALDRKILFEFAQNSLDPNLLIILGFESKAELPGNRRSPEPQGNCKRGILGKRRF